jgi:hypothetical protein
MSNPYIVVKTQKEGIHCWPNAPSDVDFLRYPHRHMFHIQVELRVFHNDRELEFFLVKRVLDRIVEEIFAENNYLISCEDIAESIQLKMKKHYPGVTGRPINVKVFEDGENGVYLKDE